MFYDALVFLKNYKVLGLAVRFFRFLTSSHQIRMYLVTLQAKVKKGKVDSNPYLPTLLVVGHSQDFHLFLPTF